MYLPGTSRSFVLDPGFGRDVAEVEISGPSLRVLRGPESCRAATEKLLAARFV